MGAAQSGAEARRVTIENLESEAMDVVYVSDEVVRRLTSGMGLELESELEKRKAACKPAASKPPLPSPTPAVAAAPVSSDAADLSRRLSEAEALNARLKADLGRSQTAERDLAARLADLKQDARMGLPAGAKEWERKMRELEQKQLEIQKAMKDKFKATVDEVSGKFFAHPPTPVCSELESKVLQCYLDNPRHTLKCNGVAQEFMECVKKERAEHMARQKPPPAGKDSLVGKTAIPA